MRNHDKLTKLFKQHLRGFNVGIVMVIGLPLFAGLVIIMEDIRVIRERNESK